MRSLTRFGRGTVAAVAIVALAVLAVPTPGQAQESPVKIGVVTIDFIVAQSSAGQDLKNRLEAFQKSAQGEIDAKAREAADLRQRINNGANSLAQARLEELAKEFEDAQIALKRLQDDKQREGQKLQADGLREIEKQLQPVFEAVRDEDGFDLILNNVPGVVVMAGAKVDITQRVIDRMNAAGGAGN